MSINTIISHLTTVCRTLQNLLLHFSLHSYALAILCLGLYSSHQVTQDLYFYVAEIQYDYRELLSKEWFSQNSSGFHLHVGKYWFKWASVTTAAIKRPKRNLEMVKEVFFLLLPEMGRWGGGSLETWWLQGFPLSIEGKEKTSTGRLNKPKMHRKLSGVNMLQGAKVRLFEMYEFNETKHHDLIKCKLSLF